QRRGAPEMAVKHDGDQENAEQAREKRQRRGREQQPARDGGGNAAEREPADDLQVDLAPVERDAAQIAEQLRDRENRDRAAHAEKPEERRQQHRRAAEARDRGERRGQKSSAPEQQEVGRRERERHFTVRR